MVQMVK